jgi:hypothetical protein
MPSLMLNCALAYSYNWHVVNKMPNAIVIANAIVVSCLRPASKARWAHVTLIPEESNIIVLSNGRPHGFKTLIPLGGQIQPIAIEGDKLAWKNAQKNAKKNITSETMKSIIPYFSPLWTSRVWFPVIASTCTSRNHTIIQSGKRIKPIVFMNVSITLDIQDAWKSIPPGDSWCIYTINPKRNCIAARDVSNGHGLGFTRWNGCCSFCLTR